MIPVKNFVKSETYRSGFLESLAIVARVHDWIKTTEFRKRWAFRLFLLILYFETTVHIAGLRHFSEAKNWYKELPIISMIMDFLTHAGAK